MNTSSPFPCIIKRLAGLISISGAFLLASGPGFAQDGKTAPSQELIEQITESWHSGKTLPLEIGRQFPPNLIGVKNDKGYNILIDVSHECSFASLWRLGGRLHQMGFRSVTNQACLDTVLDPKGKSRVRIPADTKERIYPFAWYPNFSYNVIITEQSNPNHQPYTAGEQKALVDFVNKGGSLIIMGNAPANEETMQSWSLNELVRRFGGEIRPTRERYEGTPYAALKLDGNWEVIAKGDKGSPVQAKRTFGKGKVVLMGNPNAIRRQGKNREAHEANDAFVNSLLDWTCEGQPRMKGEPRFPQPMGGGGAIYPERESIAGDIVVFYAGNQKKKLLDVINKAYPSITERIQQWLPSKPTKEPMYLILSAGSGGGWAVNSFKPKENGIISDSESGLVSIYAHELAHTMNGPVNDRGTTAGIAPIPDRGEAHAGWFQGKADAWYANSTDKPNRNCNKAFESPRFKEFDLKRYQTDPEMRKQFSNGDEWAKIWYVWQKLDDRYGPTWYPRWKWIQHTRWADDPGRRLTWEEMVEDMSLATGEDLFPFFIKIGTSLDRQQAGELSFRGRKYNLPASPLEATPAGPVRVEKIGDYKQPIVVKSASR